MDEGLLDKTKDIWDEIKKTIVGKDEIILKILMAVFADGHILIEDIPGVGKTTMALTFSKVLGLKCNRMQFTPDVMPSDVVGFNVYNREKSCFEYRDGAVMCNLFLADEINRTSPKTQSALLQVMEEGSVTVDGMERQLPKPFTVIATQNPYGSAGTQRLPESQLDRFMVCLTMGYPSVDEEIEILKSKKEQTRIKSVQAVSADELVQIKDYVRNIHVDDEIYRYVAQIAKVSRHSEAIIQGISPRGSIAIIGMAKACAFVNGRDYVIPSDVSSVIEDVAAHRIVVKHGINSKRYPAREVIRDIVKRVDVPRIGR